MTNKVSILACFPLGEIKDFFKSFKQFWFLLGLELNTQLDYVMMTNTGETLLKVYFTEKLTWVQIPNRKL